MKVLSSFGNGIKRAFLEPKMVVVLWLVNFVSASVIYFLFSGYLSDVIGNRLVAANFLKGFDFETFFELIIHEGEAWHWIFYVAFILAFLYYWVSLFLHGGILVMLKARGITGELKGRDPRFAPAFFQGAGKYFGRFFRLTIYSLLVWLGFGVLYFVLNLALKLLEAGGTNEQAIFYLFWVRVIIILFLYFLVRMICDYARIRIVAEDSKAVFGSLIQAIRFVFRNFFKTSILYYLVLITGLAIFGIYWIVQKMVPTQTLLLILVAFLIGQIFILSRGWLKIALQAAQLHFYTYIK
ncbi:MAG TPA: hypothetical protein VMW92_07075 [Candidatus Heimdallarchaeota archaeon]|nr:hypothetical protein [Candidatus Heimdallarchaeota archaeon]